eukprot:gb/GECH01013948.1/.p1 GENE.gb/GECH01013948.1/~~gb/GECH01013948.1/.p1  ORF type:complete len:219 (+),score=33.99 gb/GECH01013948.1/:1-657(+)
MNSNHRDFDELEAQMPYPHADRINRSSRKEFHHRWDYVRSHVCNDTLRAYLAKLSQHSDARYYKHIDSTELAYNLHLACLTSALDSSARKHCLPSPEEITLRVNGEKEFTKEFSNTLSKCIKYDESTAEAMDQLIYRRCLAALHSDVPFLHFERECMKTMLDSFYSLDTPCTHDLEKCMRKKQDEYGVNPGDSFRECIRTDADLIRCLHEHKARNSQI